MISVDESDENLEEFHHNAIGEDLDNFGVNESSRDNIVLQVQFAHIFLFDSSQIEGNFLLRDKSHFNELLLFVNLLNHTHDLLSL